MKHLIAALTMLFASGTVLGNEPPAQTLKGAYKDLFRIGVALNARQFGEQDPRLAQLISAQFDSISPENALKWVSIHPQPGRYAFEQADQYVAFGQKYHMSIIGHCLVWHSQVPRWVFEDADGKPLTRDALLERMHDHIQTVVGRYRGKISGWDVVNEALNDDGTMRASPWYRIVGEDYVVKAFQFAHEADPHTELYYNDYSLENDAKRQGALKLIRKLKEAGVPISGVGLQGHVHVDSPSAQKEAETIEDFAALGIKVNISELDVDVLPRTTKSDSADVATRGTATTNSNPYAEGLPPEMQQQLARRYADLFTVFVNHHTVMERVTLWGVDDGTSWLNNFPVRGRTNYPLLFDRQGHPKSAFDAVLQVATAFEHRQEHRAAPAGAGNE